MEIQHEHVLKMLKEGDLNEEVTKTIESVARDVALKFKME